MPKTKRTAASPTTILHETNAQGEHRIVLVQVEQPPEHSEWFAARTIGHFKGFSCMAVEGPLGTRGVFRISRVPFQPIGE